MQLSVKYQQLPENTRTGQSSSQARKGKGNNRSECPAKGHRDDRKMSMTETGTNEDDYHRSKKGPHHHRPIHASVEVMQTNKPLHKSNQSKETTENN
jgi:hypothetical protein